MFQRVGTLVALLLAAPAMGTMPAAVTQARDRIVECEIVGFSPRYSTDRTAFCVSREFGASSSIPTGNLVVRRSTDGMASWETLPAAGLQGLGLAMPSQLVVSPEYPDDRSIYVHVVYGNSPGIYRSVDNGNTFANVAPLASTGDAYRALSTFLGEIEPIPAPVGGGREAFAYATPAASPAVVTPPLHRPVAGAPQSTDMFLLPREFPDAPALAFVRVAAPDSPPTAPLPQVVAYRCDAAFTCATEVQKFPPGFELTNGGVVSGGGFYVVLRDFQDHRDVEVWRSTPAGVFEPWASLNGVLPLVPDDTAVFDPAVSIVDVPGVPGVYFARVSYMPEAGAAGPPADQIFESRDGGESWRRRSFGRTFTQEGRRGTMPWGQREGAWHALGDLYAPALSQLVVVAQSKDDSGSTYTGVFCSVDRGRTWSKGCSSP